MPHKSFGDNADQWPGRQATIKLAGSVWLNTIHMKLKLCISLHNLYHRLCKIGTLYDKFAIKFLDASRNYNSPSVPVGNCKSSSIILLTGLPFFCNEIFLARHSSPDWSSILSSILLLTKPHFFSSEKHQPQNQSHKNWKEKQTFLSQFLFQSCWWH